MKLYQLIWQDQDIGTRCAWAGSKAEAKARAREIRDDGAARGDIDIGQIDIPTDKAGLLAWLNAHLATDNG